MAKKKVPGLSLSELIRSTADELRDAKNTGDDAVIELSECELELSVSAAAEGSGGIKFWLIDAGASVKGETVSKIHLKFKPVGAQQFPSQEEDEGTDVKAAPAPRRTKRTSDGNA